MSHRNVEQLIGRLVTDPLSRRRFEEDPVSLLQELTAQGYELSAVEVDALAAMNPASIRTFAAAIDPRLRKVDHSSHPRHSPD
jgi:hypothetical protein